MRKRLQGQLHSDPREMASAIRFLGSQRVTDCLQLDDEKNRETTITEEERAVVGELRGSTSHSYSANGTVTQKIPDQTLDTACWAQSENVLSRL